MKKCNDETDQRRQTTLGRSRTKNSLSRSFITRVAVESERSQRWSTLESNNAAHWTKVQLKLGAAAITPIVPATSFNPPPSHSPNLMWIFAQAPIPVPFSTQTDLTKIQSKNQFSKRRNAKSTFEDFYNQYLVITFLRGNWNDIRSHKNKVQDFLKNLFSHLYYILICIRRFPKLSAVVIDDIGTCATHWDRACTHKLI